MGGINLAHVWGGRELSTPSITPRASSGFGVRFFLRVHLGEEAAFEDKPLRAGVGRQVRKSF